jgi:putative transposase
MPAMPRTARQCPGGYAYHIWNRAAGRLRLFKKDQDYLAFERTLVEAHQRHPLDLLDWCLMPNHWHFVVLPRRDGQVTAFVRWLTHAHAMRAITHRRVLGMGPLYQGRFKSLPVERDEHLRTLLSYVQRNPVRAGLVKHAAAWRWGGQWVRRRGPAELKSILAPWPLAGPRQWGRWVDRPQTPAQLEAIRVCIRRSRPLGPERWTRQTAAALGLAWTLRPRGRPANATTTITAG